VRFSVCEFTTLAVPFEAEIPLLRELGVEGMGVCEAKLPDGRDEEWAARLRDSGLAAVVCLPATLSVLPLPKFPGSEDPARRVEEICSGIRRLAAFDPVTVICLTGPVGEREPAEAREIVVAGLQRIAHEARDAGVTVALEPIHESIRSDWTMVASIREAVDLLDDVGEPDLRVLFDVWHLWDTPDVLGDIRRQAARLAPAVHVSDWRAETRGWNDRALPGDGLAPLPELLGALADAGLDDWFDLEIFSDDGAFEDDYLDSLWKLPPVQLVGRARAGFLEAWGARG
jgi:sugar phosphate isomerase/epimerase